MKTRGWRSKSFSLHGWCSLRLLLPCTRATLLGDRKLFTCVALLYFCFHALSQGKRVGEGPGGVDQGPAHLLDWGQCGGSSWITLPALHETLKG